MNCVSWYEAFAFCMWDGGRLPTEAEGQYAAQGGMLNREYPWGNIIDPSRAVYDCTGDGSATGECTYADILPVGGKPLGNGFWGHSDLAGSMAECNPDYYQSYPLESDNCPGASGSQARVKRGGSWQQAAQYVRASERDCASPAVRYGDGDLGFRCARSAH